MDRQCSSWIQLDFFHLKMLTETKMENWFDMDRATFERLLNEELGVYLASNLLAMDFNTAISFLIADAPHEIIGKIQQTLSGVVCLTMICNDSCLKCALLPSSYAKLVWFLQRLLIMSPFSKPLIKPQINKSCACDPNTHKITDTNKQQSTQDQWAYIDVLIPCFFRTMRFYLAWLR